MSYVAKILILFFIIAVLGGLLALVTWEMSPDVAEVEEIILPSNSKK
tara:strand:- start:786 stop:926 length:141 start_codon:yes stop_codon:yes gene_type:complete